MFETWKEYLAAFNGDGHETDCCDSCGMKEFDLLCKEKDDEDGSLSALFICKSCGIQKKVEYSELETN